MQKMFAESMRVMAAVAALALYTLNDVRMFQMLPRQPDPGNGQTHALSLQLWGASEGAYASYVDLVLRWGLAGLTLSLCLWAVAETLRPQAATR
jgi:hypothetical protein